MTRYMLIETFRPGAVDAIYRRLADQGRMLPEGLHFIESWLSADQVRCFQLMETDSAALFDAWTPAWADLVDFEIVPLGAKPSPKPDPTA